MDDQPLIPICPSEALADGGLGVRFPVSMRGRDDTGFVVRYRGAVHGYLNRCAHAAIELDWDKGQFFERSGLYLMCATHGAVYDPENGKCAGGPCRGAGLRPLVVIEEDGQVWWKPDDAARVPAPRPAPTLPPHPL
jgi:nitrite reductase/ring-hydroxylating ferredoxin subunit